jgi:hypothetical protein
VNQGIATDAGYQRCCDPITVESTTRPWAWDQLRTLWIGVKLAVAENAQSKKGGRIQLR